MTDSIGSAVSSTILNTQSQANVSMIKTAAQMEKAVADMIMENASNVQKSQGGGVDMYV